MVGVFAHPDGREELVVTVASGTGQPPTPLGGTVIPGDYQLSSETVYGNVPPDVILIYQIPIENLKADPGQPRKFIDPVALAELTASITKFGVLEPILVRPREGGRFTIISGERRFRAAMEAGLSDIPFSAAILLPTKEWPSCFVRAK